MSYLQKERNRPMHSKRKKKFYKRGGLDLLNGSTYDLARSNYSVDMKVMNANNKLKMFFGK